MKAVSPNDFVAINDVLCRFFLSFDRRDWASMTNCLSSLVFIDYSSSGREKPSSMSGKDFVKRRENAVDNLAKHHSFSNLLLAYEQNEDSVSARCNYLILRFGDSQSTDIGGENFFHSCGNYDFLLSRADDCWRISSITQHALQSWGNRNLHGGSRAGS
ncbi:MAG TPA: nuclear transport factor 2 family protein [Pseudomonas sp.]|nr:nuclear transport factor 2 family protein [Pseudomonas sp.]